MVGSERFWQGLVESGRALHGLLVFFGESFGGPGPLPRPQNQTRYLGKSVHAIGGITENNSGILAGGIVFGRNAENKVAICDSGFFSGRITENK